MRVVLDTNVLVRAAGRASSPAREVFLRVLEPPHTLVASAYLLDELRRVLNYPRVQAAHGLSVEKAERHVGDVATSAEIVEVSSSIPSAVPQDPGDDPIVDTAVLGRANALCTRDGHLHSPTVIEYCRQFGIRILTDVELLNELRALDQEKSE